MAKIEVSINENVGKELQRLSKSLADMSPAFKDIADYEWGQTRLRYKKEIDPDGKKWPDSFTIRRGTGPETGSGRFAKTTGWDYVKASNYHATPPGYRFFDASKGDKILRDTGTMFNSIGRAYGKDFALVGTNLKYARNHQEGIGVKQRTFLGLNKKSLENIRKTVTSYLIGAKK